MKSLSLHNFSIIYITTTNNVLTLFDMGGMMAPKMFLTIVLKSSGEGSWNLVTFNINLWNIKKIFLVP